MGFTHACAVTWTGSLVCWGANATKYYGGQLRIPAYFNAPNRAVESVSCGMWHTCAVFVGGQLSCFGGTGLFNFTQADVPRSLLGLPVSAVVAGTYHTCVSVKFTGVVSCFGSDVFNVTNSVPVTLSTPGTCERGALTLPTATASGSPSPTATRIPDYYPPVNVPLSLVPDGITYSTGFTVYSYGLVNPNAPISYPAQSSGSRCDAFNPNAKGNYMQYTLPNRAPLGGTLAVTLCGVAGTTLDGTAVPALSNPMIFAKIFVTSVLDSSSDALFSNCSASIVTANSPGVCSGSTGTVLTIPSLSAKSWVFMVQPHTGYTANGGYMVNVSYSFASTSSMTATASPTPVPAPCAPLSLTVGVQHACAVGRSGIPVRRVKV